MFAVGVNDIVDLPIDKLTNTHRPLVTSTLGEEDVKQSAFIFITLALLSAFLAGFTSFFFVLGFNALYYIYSAPPTRFKMIPFFSSFLIGLCCLSAVLAGFFLISPVKSFSAVPVSLAVAVVVVFFLSSHIRDMKDIEGDKAERIPTVPVLFGPIWGPRVVGVLSSLAYISIPLFTGVYILFFPSIIASYMNYFFVTKIPYQEKYVFRTYFVYVLFLMIFFYFTLRLF
jgi:4-hydroxybenzoate polyprenyltransferase